MTSTHNVGKTCSSFPLWPNGFTPGFPLNVAAWFERLGSLAAPRVARFPAFGLGEGGKTALDDYTLPELLKEQERDIENQERSGRAGEQAPTHQPSAPSFTRLCYQSKGLVLLAPGAQKETRPLPS